MKTYRGVDPRGTSGKISVVHAQITVVALVVIGQLWLLTVALEQLQTGEMMGVVTATLISGAGFLLSLSTLLAFRD